MIDLDEIRRRITHTHLCDDCRVNLEHALSAVSGSSRRAQVAEAVDPLASCPYYSGRGKCTFGCSTEPRCIAEEPEGGWLAERRAQEQWVIIRAAIAWRRTIADSGEYALDDADALVEAVDALLYDDGELPGMWERADHTGGLDEVREPERPVARAFLGEPVCDKPGCPCRGAEPERPVDLWFGIRPPSMPGGS